MDLTISSELSMTTVLVFGFLLGLKHAVEADHVAAVATIAAERRNIFSSTVVGVFWGGGHTLSLLVVGVLVVFLKLQISETVEARLEAIVGVMLVVLGLNAIRKLRQKEHIHIHAHRHDGHEHTHIHAHDKSEIPKTHHVLRLSLRSTLIGMVHGLAGSAALMLLIVPAISSPFTALLYILVFGIGSIGGMILMSLVISLPIHLTAGRFQILNKVVLGMAGVFSLGLGVFIIYAKIL